MTQWESRMIPIPLYKLLVTVKYKWTEGHTDKILGPIKSGEVYVFLR